MDSALLCQTISDILKQHNVPHAQYQHGAILSYDDAEREKDIHGWNGTESKSVCLIGSDGSCVVYVTVQGKRADTKRLKELTGVKYRLADEAELAYHTACVPGCVSPFGFPQSVTLAVDESVFGVGEYLFSPGIATKTIQMDSAFLKSIFSALPNRVLYLADV